MATREAHAPSDFPGRAIEVRSLGPADIFDALKEGFEDFCVKPSYMFVFGLIYPIGAAAAALIVLDLDVIPLVFPAVSGLALTGPFAAILLYEISRRREAGRDFAWSDAPDVFRAASSWAVAGLGFILLAVFAIWLAVAQAIYDATLANAGSSSLGEFLRLTLTTREGWRLIVIGDIAGFLFAAAVLATNVVSFPMLLDRKVGPATAVATSLRVTAKSPVAVALWGLIIAALMAAGSLLLLVGLAVVLPVLGHASWRVYRKAVAC